MQTQRPSCPCSTGRRPVWNAGLLGIVTLLGDAIHNMPPTGEEGANMALRDAEVLRSALRCSQDGHHPLGSALTEYENQMLQYAFKAVDTSMVNHASHGHA